MRVLHVIPGVAPRYGGPSHAIVGMLTDTNRRIALGNNGWALAAHYSWQSCGQRVEAAIQSVLTNQPFPANLQPA